MVAIKSITGSHVKQAMIISSIFGFFNPPPPHSDWSNTTAISCISPQRKRIGIDEIPLQWSSDINRLQLIGQKWKQGGTANFYPFSWFRCTEVSVSVSTMLRLHDFVFSIRCLKRRNHIYLQLFCFYHFFRQLWECDTQVKLQKINSHLAVTVVFFLFCVCLTALQKCMYLLIWRSWVICVGKFEMLLSDHTLELSGFESF